MKNLLRVLNTPLSLPFFRRKAYFQPVPSINLMTDYAAPSYNPPSYTNHSSSTNTFFNPKKLKRFFKNSAYLPFVLVIILVGAVAFFAIKTVITKSSGSAPSVLSSDKRQDVERPVAQQVLNREFRFPLKDANGKELSQLKYVIQNAELRNSIVIRGEKATAVKGRTFLVINLKITNNYDKTIELKTRDYLRLTTGSSSEKLAPDIHNDPVEVQAISTKYTRLGFPINDNEKDLTLQVGEISGPKTSIKLTLN